MISERENTQSDVYSKHNISLRYLGKKGPGVVVYPGVYEVYSQFDKSIIHVTAQALLDLADLINERGPEIEGYRDAQNQEEGILGKH